MNWDAIGAVGETVGAAGVIASLIYLAIQVRTQNRESRLAAMHEIAEAFRDATSTLATLEFTQLADKSHQDFESLTVPEKVVLFGRFQNMFRVCEEAYIQYEEGRLDERYWTGMKKYIETVLGIPIIRIFWSARKFLFDEEFVSFVDSLTPREWKFS